MISKGIVKHELDIFFGNCMKRMQDTEKDWVYVIEWSQRYADQKGNDQEVVEMILDHINQLEKKFGHKNAL